jgi:hypothetical protein
LRPFLLKVLNDVTHRREAINTTNPILGSFNAKQVADRRMGLDEPQNHSALGEFGIEV